MGLSMADLDVLSVGTIFDMMTELGNDEYDYSKENQKRSVRMATQEDIDRL